MHTCITYYIGSRILYLPLIRVKEMQNLNLEKGFYFVFFINCFCNIWWSLKICEGKICHRLASFSPVFFTGIYTNFWMCGGGGAIIFEKKYPLKNYKVTRWWPTLWGQNWYAILSAILSSCSPDISPASRRF